jgi:hypothetical protein
LSSSVIGGITGGVLGSLLLSCIAIIWYLVRRQKGGGGSITAVRSSAIAVERQESAGARLNAEEVVDVGGRLKYPSMEEHPGSVE